MQSNNMQFIAHFISCDARNKMCNELCIALISYINASKVDCNFLPNVAQRLQGRKCNLLHHLIATRFTRNCKRVNNMRISTNRTSPVWRDIVMLDHSFTRGRAQHPRGELQEKVRTFFIKFCNFHDFWGFCDFYDFWRFLTIFDDFLGPRGVRCIQHEVTFRASVSWIKSTFLTRTRYTFVWQILHFF